MRWIAWLSLVPTGCGNDTVVVEPDDACPPLFTRGPEGCVFDEEQVVRTAQTFRDGQLVKINDEPFLQVFGNPIRRNVWVSPIPLPDGRTAADLYRTVDPLSEVVLDAAFPVGSIVVHEAVDREEGHAVQVRREDTWDDGNGRHWWFVKYFDDGTVDDSACTPCEACHSATLRPGSDGLWGVPRDAL